MCERFSSSHRAIFSEYERDMVQVILSPEERTDVESRARPMKLNEPHAGPVHSRAEHGYVRPRFRGESDGDYRTRSRSSGACLVSRVDERTAVQAPNRRDPRLTISPMFRVRSQLT